MKNVKKKYLKYASKEHKKGNNKMTEKFIFEDERRDMAMVAKKFFDRSRTNVAGGNISEKIVPEKSFDYGDIHIEKNHPYIIITPTMMSEAWFGNLEAAQILVVDLETGKKLDGSGRLTREINMHEEAYKVNPKISVVYHSHAPKSMFWGTSGLDEPNITEITKVQLKLGKIKCLPYREACTKSLADLVSQELKDRKDQVDNILLLNSHGVLITSNDLHRAAMILETTEWNAEIAYKQAVFQKLGLLNGYKSCGKTVKK
jgi:L-fuculose-phosphate aldolase